MGDVVNNHWLDFLVIVEAMLATVQEEFHITDEQVETFYAKFMSKLPESMQHLLQVA